MTKEEHVQTYVVQLELDGRWETQATFFVDERKEAIQAAKDLFKDDNYLNVRVIYESYNHKGSFHTNAVVYQSTPKKRLDPDYIARFIKERKIKPLNLGEYIGVLICVVLFGVVAGVTVLLATSLLLDLYFLNLAAKTKEAVMYGLSSLGGFFAFYVAGQYVRKNYRYDRRKQMSLLKQEMAQKAEKARQNYVSPISNIVQYEMNIAASDISAMPVNDHKRGDISPYEEMDRPEELMAAHEEIAAQERQQQTALEKEQARYKKLTAFLSAFLADCLYALHKKNIDLQGEIRFGVMLVMMGVCDYYVNHLSLEEEAEEELKMLLLLKLGLKRRDADAFLLELERYYQNPQYQNVINKGAQMAVLAKTARKKSAEQIVPILKNWLKEVRGQEREESRDYILACQIIPTSEGTSDDPYWPAPWGAFLGQFTSYIFDYDEDHHALLMSFRTIRGVYEASDLVRDGMRDWQAADEEEQPNILRFGLCHISEDEVYGDHALALIEHVQDDALYFTQAVYDSMEDQESYLISEFPVFESQQGKMPLYRFDSLKEGEEAVESPATTKHKSLELQDFAKTP